MNDDYGYLDYINEALDDYVDATGFLTNFPQYQLPIYQKALEQFEVDESCEGLRERVGFKIDAGYEGGLGLYVTGDRCDLGLFWRMFERVEKGMKS